jgi:hypothetical protein
MHTQELPKGFVIPNHRTRRLHLQAQPSRNKSTFFGIRKQFVPVELSNGKTSIKVITHRPKPSIGVYFKSK